MFEKIKNMIKIEKKFNPGIFTESTLKTSFYEELQKNGWCDIVDDSKRTISSTLTNICRSHG